MGFPKDDVPNIYCFSREADSEIPQKQNQKLDPRRAKSKWKGQRPHRKWVSLRKLRKLLRGSEQRRVLEQDEQLDGEKRHTESLPQLESLLYTPMGSEMKSKCRAKPAFESSQLGGKYGARCQTIVRWSSIIAVVPGNWVLIPTEISPLETSQH